MKIKIPSLEKYSLPNTRFRVYESDLESKEVNYLIN